MEPKVAGWRGRSVFERTVLLYGATSMTSAALVFAIQPMFSKMVLPLLGGAPAVWNTAMMFFQGALLLGYLYAHLLTRHLSWRNQVSLHLGLISIAFFALPIAPMAGWVPPTTELPILWLIGLLSVSIGLPFFAIAANAPILQHWFSRSAHPAARDPYFLYAASNFGSIAALLSYPTLIEPLLGLDRQSFVWSAAYVALFALIAVCALSIRSNARAVVYADADRVERTGRSSVTWRRRFHWIALAFVPSSLLLGVTTHITTDIAAAPFIWVLPLSLYLLSFVLVFSRRSLLKHSWMIKAQPYLVIFVAVTMWGAAQAWLYYLLLHLCVFFVCAMVCHGELAKRRPGAAELTEYYFYLSLGGLLGGIFNALVAPLIFDTVAEYPVALVLACLLRPAPVRNGNAQRVLDVLLPAGLFLAVIVPALAFDLDAYRLGLILLLPLLNIVGVVLFSFRERPVRFALGIGVAIIALSITAEPQNVLTRKRSFFGSHWIQSASAGQFNVLWHGTTEHGAQYTNAALWREPLSYYHRDGPFGQIFAAYAQAGIFERVGVIGLGAGALACYREPGQEWSFFEIDPAVVELAKSSGYFHYLSECADDSPIVLGDARLSLARVRDGTFGLLIVDAFSSDAIPLHLVTREAVALYLSKLRSDGILALHISNRHLDLAPVLAALAQDAGLVAFAPPTGEMNAQQLAARKREAQVVVIARSEARLDPLRVGHGWRVLRTSRNNAIWTDDYSNLLSALRK